MINRVQVHTCSHSLSVLLSLDLFSYQQVYFCKFETRFWKFRTIEPPIHPVFPIHQGAEKTLCVQNTYNFFWWFVLFLISTWSVITVISHQQLCFSVGNGWKCFRLYLLPSGSEVFAASIHRCQIFSWWLLSNTTSKPSLAAPAPSLPSATPFSHFSCCSSFFSYISCPSCSSSLSSFSFHSSFSSHFSFSSATHPAPHHPISPLTLSPPLPPAHPSPRSPPPAHLSPFTSPSPPPLRPTPPPVSFWKNYIKKKW